MKSNIILLYQNVQDLQALKKGIEQAAKLIKERTKGALEIVVDLKESTQKFKTQVMPNCVCVDPWQILAEARQAEVVNNKDYNVACLVYDWEQTTGPRATNPVQNGVVFEGFTAIQVPMQWYTDTTVQPIKTYPEVFCDFFLHELCHAWYYLTNTQIDPDLEDETHSLGDRRAEFGNMTPQDYYLLLIEKLAPYYSRFTQPEKSNASFTYDYRTNLSPGSTGPEVVALQKGLIVTGDFYSKMPGDTQPAPNFGPVTTKSVQRYQKRKGITPVLGNFHEKTRMALTADLQAAAKKKALK